MLLYARGFLTPEERGQLRTLLSPAAIRSSLAAARGGPRGEGERAEAPASGRAGVPEAFEEADRDSDRL